MASNNLGGAAPMRGIENNNDLKPTRFEMESPLYGTPPSPTPIEEVNTTIHNIMITIIVILCIRL